MNQTIYLVQEWQWRVGHDNTEEVKKGDPRPDVRANPDYPNRYEIVLYHRSEDEGALPVRAFLDYGKAEAFRRTSESARRKRTNPFRYGMLVQHWTSFDEGRLRDWLLDGSLTPPGHEGEEKPDKVRQAWLKWWHKHRDTVEERVRLGLARALNNGLAGMSYGQDSVEGRSDREWMDEHFEHMDKMSADQRACVRTGLFASGLWDWPSPSGERDFHKVATMWRKWWDRVTRKASDWQLEHVWEAMDKVRFYEVLELPQED